MSFSINTGTTLSERLQFVIDQMKPRNVQYCKDHLEAILKDADKIKDQIEALRISDHKLTFFPVTDEFVQAFGEVASILTANVGPSHWDYPTPNEKARKGSCVIPPEYKEKVMEALEFILAFRDQLIKLQ